jgi:hypothetical protein
MKFYFVSSGRKSAVELEVIKDLQPKRILGSYHYFKNIKLADFFEEIGYKPDFVLDSGAYSAFNSGKVINQEKYNTYIKENEQHISWYICLDKLGDNEKSYEAYENMKKQGLSPVPVFHYMGDETFLEKYIEQGEKTIALGGTVPIKSKPAVAEWVRMLGWQYPEVKFHLLGSSARVILDHCDIDSADAATWIIGAINGKPKHIPGNDKESRKKRAKWNMKEIMLRY